jgi:membrane protein DedA with SNARE-associated domain
MGFLAHFDLGSITQWMVSNGYALLFLGMLVEGPVVTAAAAFAAALGLLDIWLVFLTSLLGNLIPDVIYYSLGYWGRQKFVNKYGHYLRLTPDRIRKLESMIEHHAGKSLIAIKLIPFLATPGLIIAGVTRMNIRKYILWSISITIPSSVAYLLIGFYSGAAYSRFVHYINIGAYIIAGAIVLFFLVSYLQKKFGEDWERRMNKDDDKGSSDPS